MGVGFGGFMKTQILFCLLMLIVARESFAWGTVGHKSTALIAETYLSPQSKAMVRDLLEGERLVDVANWADNLKDRPEYAHTIPYHYQNTRTALRGPVDMNNYKQNLLQLSPSDRRNYRAGVVEAIAGSEKVLKDPMSNHREKQMALKFLVHFVGDLHQPMHTGEARNHGGNPIKLTWKGSETNLHKVWDSDIIYGKIQKISGYSYRDPSWTYAQWLLDQNMDAATAPQVLGNVSTWYQESLSYQKMAYDPKYNQAQDQYATVAGKTIDQRILQGGRRLGEMLNQIFANESVQSPDRQVIQFAEKILGSLEKFICLKPRAVAQY
jgi:hypothetical protein